MMRTQPWTGTIFDIARLLRHQLAGDLSITPWDLPVWSEPAVDKPKLLDPFGNQCFLIQCEHLSVAINLTAHPPTQ